jgi:hypothetical protein
LFPLLFRNLILIPSGFGVVAYTQHALMFGGSYLSSAIRIMHELVDWADAVEGGE